MAAPSEKLENCEVCAANKAKYTCPKCEVRTCSLTCVNIHKKELDCDGIRDKTKFISLKGFTDLDLLSDYRLLEGVNRSVDGFKRNPVKKYTRQCDLPVHLNRLRAAAFRRKINLRFMPQNFSRHKTNTTFLKWATNELFWRIEWIFPQAENTKWVVERALESTRLSNLLEQILEPIKSLETTADIEELNLRKDLHDRLQFYRAAGISGVKVLLKAENVQKSNSRFYELDSTLTLTENFENKTIVEFPTFFVILKDHLDMYEIIDSDDEEQNDTSNQDRNNVRQRRKRPYRKNEIKDKDTPTNYFFNTEFSESEDEMQNKKQC